MKFRVLAPGYIRCCVPVEPSQTSLGDLQRLVEADEVQITAQTVFGKIYEIVEQDVPAADPREIDFRQRGLLWRMPTGSRLTQSKRPNVEPHAAANSCQ